MTDAVVVLQARMASARLPGKVLAPLAGRSLLAHCVARLSAAGVGPVIVATTEGPEDEAIEREAVALGASVVRGPGADVLGRFVLAVGNVPVRYVVRATADNPVVDIEAARRTLGLLRACEADHAVETNLPTGAAVEAMTIEALRRAAAEATSSHDREHVTPYLRRESWFRAVTAPAPALVRRPDLRFTVDTAPELDYVRHVLAEGRSDSALLPLVEAIAAADRLCAIGRAS
jgi:spore coat polysaccharide biosynthesis protein SpsF